MSGVYIKGFPVPNNCGACPLRLAWCRERVYMVERPQRCPLIPVPDYVNGTPLSDFRLIPSNADRIRQMTDEELAELISKWAFCDECVKLFGFKVCKTKCCSDHWLDWLKSPVED